MITGLVRHSKSKKLLEALNVWYFYDYFNNSRGFERLISDLAFIRHLNSVGISILDYLVFIFFRIVRVLNGLICMQHKIALPV